MSKKNSQPCYQYYINQATNELDLILHDIIGFEGTQSKDFHQLLEDKSFKNINLDINSDGGSVSHGISIYNALKAHPAKVNVKISGVAASMASVVAMAGDEIEMPETTFLMIHKPMISLMVGPNADDLRKTADTLDKMEESIVLAFKSRMDKTEDEIAGMLRATTWFSASEAKEAGLADVVTEEEIEIVNYFDFSKYENVPQEVLNRYDLKAKKEQSIISKIKNVFKTTPEKEEENMSDVTVNQLTNQLNDAQKENASLSERITNLEAENTTLKETQANAEKEIVMNNSKTFLAEMIKEGRVRPVDEKMHLSNMINKDKEGLESYKNWLKEFPVIVDLSTEQIATKETAKPSSMTNKDDELTKEAKKIVAEKKCTWIQALDIIRNEKPELCN